MAETVVAPLAGAGITPNTVTVAGLFLNGAVALCSPPAGCRPEGFSSCWRVGSTCWMALSPVEPRTSARSGGSLDSTLDRYSEAIVLIGLVYAQTIDRHTLNVTLIAAMLTGSFLISYTGARAEGLGIECKVGLLPRPERIIVLAVGLIFFRCWPRF